MSGDLLLEKQVKKVNSKEITEKLCEEHIKLVGFIIAKEFRCFTEKYPYLREDLYQEGSIGLFEAAKKYNKSKGEFSTIACICIRNNMIKFVNRYAYKHYNKTYISINEDNRNDSGDKPVTLEGLLGIDITDNIEYLIEKEELKSIKESIKNCKITDIEKIVGLRLKGYSQTEIGNKLGYKQVQVSRKLQQLDRDIKIKKRLRNALAEVC